MEASEFVAKYGDDPRVAEWLKNNPPPAEWKESAIMYAFLEMPLWVLWRKK